MGLPRGPVVISLRPLDPEDPGARLRVEYPLPGETGTHYAVISEERVLPEAIMRVDAHHVDAHGSIWLSRDDIAWLHAQLGALLLEMPV